MTTATDTLRDYFDRCEAHDWYFEMSDDHSVWRRGLAADAALRAEAKTDAAKQAILDGWAKHMFTGQPWGNERAARPVRP